MTNEADTCREHVVPKLKAAGWDVEPHSITEQRTFTEPPKPQRRNYYVDGGSIKVAHQVVYEVDAGDKQLRVIEYTDHTAETGGSLYPTPDELRDAWSLPDDRQDLFDEHGPEARAILNDLLDKNAEHRIGQFTLPEALQCHLSAKGGTSARSSRGFGRTGKLFKSAMSRPSKNFSAKGGNCRDAHHGMDSSGRQ